MVYSKRSNPEVCGRCTLFVLNGSHLSYVVEEGGARLHPLQSRRIFHIAYIPTLMESFFLVFIAARLKVFTVQIGMFIAGEEARQQS